MRIIIAIILSLPCYLVCNESEAIWVNIVGAIYTLCLYGFFHTEKGKDFGKRLMKDIEL